MSIGRKKKKNCKEQRNQVMQRKKANNAQKHIKTFSILVFLAHRAY